MSVLATSDWSGTGSLSANWSTATNCFAMDVLSGEARAANDPCGSRYNAVTPPNDQWCQATLGTLTAAGNDGIGPAVRQVSGADSKYCAYGDLGQHIILKVSAGSYSQIGSSGGACATNDVLYIEAQGTAIVVKKNGSTTISTTDSAVSSGFLAMFGSDDSGASVEPTLKDWSGGDFLGGGTNPKGVLGNPFVGPFGGPI